MIEKYRGFIGNPIANLEEWEALLFPNPMEIKMLTKASKHTESEKQTVLTSRYFLAKHGHFLSQHGHAEVDSAPL
jgi:hypothetical protein